MIERKQNHRRRHLVSEIPPASDNAFDGPIRNEMAAQCLLSSISRSLFNTSEILR